MEKVPCNLCGSTRHLPAYVMPDRRFFPDEMFHVVECADCGLGFVNPRPTMEEMRKYYPKEYFQQPTTASFDKYLTRRFSQQARYLEATRDGAGGGCLLDVGCLNGEFPRFMAARGWQVEGVEVSQASAPITDFHVYPQEFHHIPVNEPRYDAVTAWAVLEHVHDPMAYFRKAAQVLRSGGVFVFLVTNFESAASRRLFCEDVPRHLYFFAPDTVRRYLREVGLKPEKEDNDRAVYKMAPDNWLSYVWQTKVRGREFRYADIPLSSREFREKYGLKRGLTTSLRYLAYSPAAVFDRVMQPFVEGAQILRKTYGISVYAARKA